MTRLPMPHPDGAVPANLARAQRCFPLVGASVGAAVGIVYAGLLALSVPALAAAALALGASALLTGALHEDGLADVADGFGGGRDRTSKLEIMRDSRLGTYGALILLVSFVARLSALAALPASDAFAALIAAYSLARGVLPTLALRLPYARSDGLAAKAGRAEPPTAIIAAGFAVMIALLCLPPLLAVAAVLLTGFAAAAIGWLAIRQVGGQTGDVLGATEQVAETAVLLLLAASLS